MQLPSFDEFLAEFKGKEHDLLKRMPTKEEPSNIKEAIGLSAQASVFATFEILRMYHQWLSQHLESLNN